jgi:signal peptidase II
VSEETQHARRLPTGVVVALVASIVVVSDQLTKQLILSKFDHGESRTVIEGFFDLTYIRNSGAAWGMFKDHGMMLIGVSIAMLIFMCVFYRSLVADAREHRFAFGLLLGGIIGNLMDRIRLSAVTDFLDFYIGSYHWPAFNIADSSICIGVGVYLLSTFWMKNHPLHAANNAQ